MAVLEILKEGNSILRTVCEEVDLTTEKEYISELVANMLETVKFVDGAGIAAPQVGVTKNVIIVRDIKNNKFFEMINPEILWTSFDKQFEYEGCLSILDENNKPIHKRVVRYDRVKVKWQDLDGNIHEEKINDRLLSRIIQHETDHLKGKLFIDYLEKE